MKKIFDFKFLLMLILGFSLGLQLGGFFDAIAGDPFYMNLGQVIAVAFLFFFLIYQYLKTSK